MLTVVIYFCYVQGVVAGFHMVQTGKANYKIDNFTLFINPVSFHLSCNVYLVVRYAPGHRVVFLIVYETAMIMQIDLRMI